MKNNDTNILKAFFLMIFILLILLMQEFRLSPIVSIIILSLFPIAVFLFIHIAAKPLNELLGDKEKETKEDKSLISNTCFPSKSK